MGGDQTTDPFMAINDSPTTPPNNTMGFFTGTDDFMFTRRMALWLNQEYISIYRKDYDSISQLSDRYVEPWTGRDYVSKIPYNFSSWEQTGSPSTATSSRAKD